MKIICVKIYKYLHLTIILNLASSVYQKTTSITLMIDAPPSLRELSSSLAVGDNFLFNQEPFHQIHASFTYTIN
jgi:hypothetical protein